MRNEVTLVLLLWPARSHRPACRLILPAAGVRRRRSPSRRSTGPACQHTADITVREAGNPANTSSGGCC